LAAAAKVEKSYLFSIFRRSTLNFVWSFTSSLH